MAISFTELCIKHCPDGVRYQKPLADFCIVHKLTNIIETGSGVSSLCLLQALDKMDKGTLISIDPFPFCQFEVTHPKYELIKKKSYQALADLFIKDGPWDMFLHDSDHWIECQTMEYEVAYACVRPGGWIFSDDYEWDGHYAWAKFLEQYKLKPVVVGNIQGVQKTSAFVISKGIVKSFVKQVWEDAKVSGAKWRKENNRLPCNSCEDGFSEYWKYPYQ